MTRITSALPPSGGDSRPAARSKTPLHDNDSMSIDDVPPGAGTNRPPAASAGHPPGSNSGLDPGPDADPTTVGNGSDTATAVGGENADAPAVPNAGNEALAAAMATVEGTQRRFPEGQRRIYLAAIDAFSERGFHATTTRDIAGRAGLSPAGLYVHFRSKEEVLHRISLASVRLTLQVATTASTTDGTISERLTATVRDLARWHALHSGSVRVVLHHLTDLTPEHRAEVTDVQRALHGLVRDLVAEGMTAGDFDTTDPSATALALLSLCVDTARWYLPAYRRTPEEIGENYAALALRMVGAPRP